MPTVRQKEFFLFVLSLRHTCALICYTLRWRDCLGQVVLVSLESKEISLLCAH